MKYKLIFTPEIVVFEGHSFSNPSSKILKLISLINNSVIIKKKSY